MEMMRIYKWKCRKTLRYAPRKLIVFGFCVNLTLDDFDILELDGVQDFVINPKKDLFGLGFDPFKNAPEFRGQDYLQSVIHPLYLVEYHAPRGYNCDVFVQSVSVLWRRTVLAMVVGKATL